MSSVRDSSYIILFILYLIYVVLDKEKNTQQKYDKQICFYLHIQKPTYLMKLLKTLIHDLWPIIPFTAEYMYAMCFSGPN